jgi:lipase chaperone LimK
VSKLDHIDDDQRFTPERAQWEIKMLQSRYESEQRQRVEINKRIDQMQKIVDIQQETIRRQEDEIKDHRKMLLNGGTGLMFRMRDQETKQLSWREWTAMAISIGSLLYAIFGK